MKRLYMQVCIVLSMVLLAGCTTTNGDEATGSPQASGTPAGDEVTISGTVYEVNESGIMVCDISGEGVRLVSVSVADAAIERDGWNEVGAKVEIATGAVAESYPEQCAASSIKLVEDASEGGYGGAGLYAMFEQLYNDDVALNEGEYMAVDLSLAKLNDAAKAVLLAKMQQFCMANELTLLQGDMESLTGQGYIKEEDGFMSFEEGYVISFSNITIQPDGVHAEASKWKTSLAAIGGKFTAAQIDGQWVVEGTDLWISRALGIESARA